MVTLTTTGRTTENLDQVTFPIIQHDPTSSSIHTPQTESYTSKVWDVSRALGFQPICQALLEACGLHTREVKHVAIRKSRTIAFFIALLHFLPRSGAVTLVWLICRVYYIGHELAGSIGQDNLRLLSLQFAAKVHELLMITSLSAVVFTIIQAFLVFGDGVPLGALSAGMQVNHVAFLWSKEFLGICASPFTSSVRKAGFILVLILCTLLGVTVGPSSATLMKREEAY